MRSCFDKALADGRGVLPVASWSAGAVEGCPAGQGLLSRTSRERVSTRLHSGPSKLRAFAYGHKCLGGSDQDLELQEGE